MSLSKKILFVLFVLSIGIFFYITNSSYRIAKVEIYYQSLMKKLFDISTKKEIVEQNNIKSLERGKISLSDGTVVADGKLLYKMMLYSKISDTDFESLKEDLKDIVKFDKSKFKKDENSKYIVVNFALTAEQVLKVNNIVSKYKLYEDNEIFYKPIITQLSGYERFYPKDDFLSPFLGYTIKSEMPNNLTKTYGVDGIDGYYNKHLASNVNITLNLDYNKQIALQKEVDKLKRDLDKYEVSSIVLNLTSGYVDSIASSNRVNPNNITLENSDHLKHLNPSIIKNLFNIDLFCEPILQAMNKANLKEEDFGLLSKSKLDLKYERPSFKKDNVLKINFMQLIKAYSVFYNDGIMKDFVIVKENQISQKQIIDKNLANEIKNQLDNFYKSIENKKVVLEFEDYKQTASIKIDYFEENNQKYLKAYFFVDKK